MKHRLFCAGAALLPCLCAPALLGQDSWATTDTGSWFDGLNWTDGTVPTAADSVTIAVSGTPYTVQLFGNAIIDSLSLSSDDATLYTSTAGPLFTLEVVGATTISNGTLLSSGSYTFNTTGGIINSGGLFQSSGHATTTVNNGFTNSPGAELKVRGVRNSLGTATFGAALTINGGLNNSGLLSFETNRGANGGTFARLTVPGTITNTGAIESRLFEGTATGGRWIKAASFNSSGSFTNNDVSNFLFNQADATYQNSGTMDAANGGIQFSGLESFDNFPAGQLTGSTFTLQGNNSATSCVTNAGSINLTGELGVSQVNTLINSGTITSSTGSLDLTANSQPTSRIENTATGVIDFNNGGLLDSAEDIDNAGGINVNAGTLIVELGQGSNNGNQLNNTGEIEVAPGAVLNLRQQFFGGEGPAVLNMDPGSTLDGGGDIFFTRVTGNINTPWSPGTSLLDVNLGSLSGAGPLNISSSLVVRGTTLNVPVNNTGTTTLQKNGNSIAINGIFTNEAAGIVNADSALTGNVNVLLNNNDFINRGEFNLTGNTTSGLNPLNTTTSTGSFVNVASGTVNITGTGTRDWDVPLDNRGTFNLNNKLTSNRTANTFLNSGAITAPADWVITNGLSFENSGQLTSTGGNFDFRFNQAPTSHFTNTATGTWTIENGAFLDNAEDVNNAGDIFINNGTFSMQLALGGGNTTQFTNTGDIELAPGTALSITRQGFGGEGSAVVNLEPGSTLDGGGDIFMTSTITNINGPWSPGTSLLDVNFGSLSGAGPLDISSTFVVRGGTVSVPVNNSGTTTFRKSGSFIDLHGAFTNEAAGIVNADSALAGTINLRLHNNDFSNRGEFNLTGNATSGLNPFNTTTSTGSFVNVASGTVNITGTGTRDWDVPLDNRGAFNLNNKLTSNRTANTFLNSGAITAPADWDITNGLSFENSGQLTSTGGNFDFRFNQAATSHFTNTATGTWTIENGAFLDNAEDVNNAGAIFINNGTFSMQLALGGGNTTQFTNTGDIELAPGTALSITRQGFGGEGSAVVNLEPGSTLDGGGDIFMTSTITNINGPWSPGTSLLDVNFGSLSGAGPLNISSTFVVRGGTVSVPVNNSGTTTFRKSGSFIDLHGAFTNEAAGIVNADSALAGTINLRLHNNDFSNRGEFNLTGNTTSGLNPFNTTTSTGSFVNVASGTVNITGTGTRDWDVPLDNRGAFNLNNTLTSNRTGITYQNSGAITAAADWDITNGLSFENSGQLTSTGGNFDFRFNQAATSHFTNTATGTWTIENGAFLDNAEDVNNAGDIIVNNGTFSMQLALGGGNTTQFTNTGDIELAPGTALSITRQGFGGEGSAVVNLEPGSTLDGGGDIFMTSTITNINGPWSPNESRLDVNAGTLSGVGPLSISSSLVVRGGTINTPVSNSGTTTFQRSGSFVSLDGAFTNEVAGIASADSSISGAVNLRLNNNDFTNHGQFHLTGNTTSEVSLANSTTSTATFVNGATGTVTINGTNGTRRIRSNIDNRGTIVCERATTFGTSPKTITNSGEIRISPGVVATFQAGSTTNEPTGILSGTGSLALALANFTNNGIVSPGLSVGTLSATGTFTNGPTARHLIEITSLAGPGTGNDFLSVGGSLAMNGTVVPKLTGFYPEIGDEVIIAQCTGTLSGTATVSNAPGLYPDFSVTVDPALKQVILTVTDIENLSFEQFQNLFFTDEQIANGDADPNNDFDQDGLDTLLEWVYGDDPTSATRRTPNPVMGTNGSENLVFTYPESTLLPPIDIAFQSNPDLQGAWSDVPAIDYTRSEAPLPGVPNVNLVTLEITNPTFAAAIRNFFRVEFAFPPQ